MMARRTQAQRNADFEALDATVARIDTIVAELRILRVEVALVEGTAAELRIARASVLWDELHVLNVEYALLLARVSDLPDNNPEGA